MSLEVFLFRPSSAGSVYSPFWDSSVPLILLLGGVGESSTMGGRDETRTGGGGRRPAVFGLRDGPMLLRVSTRLSMSLWMGESVSGEGGGVEVGAAGSEVSSTRVALNSPVKLEESVSSRLLQEDAGSC